MSFGPARGVDYETFCRLVKKLVLVVIVGNERKELQLPLEYYNRHVVVNQ